jgi:sterol 3beta-glucosyltransferase
MRVVMAAFGTMGDVQPLLALGARLQRRAHDVVLAASPDFASHAARAGLAFLPLGPALDYQELRTTFAAAYDEPDIADQVRLTLAVVLPKVPGMLAQLRQACGGADVLVSLPYQLAGQLVHELDRVPFASLHLSPFGGFSRRFAAEGARWINELRAAHGLGPVRDPLGRDGASPTLALCPVSRHVFRRPKRWPAHHRLSGFLFLDEVYEPDDDLARFIAAGPPPVVVSFGSMLHRSPERLVTLVIDALRQIGARAIVQRGWTGFDPVGVPPNLYLASYVPHAWLFARAACVVHAGGAGTTAACLRAGVPTVVVPHFLDQSLWANIARENGCSLHAVALGELSAERLALAIAETLASSACAASAAALGEAIRSEDGAAEAADLLEAHFEPHHGRRRAEPPAHAS